MTLRLDEIPTVRCEVRLVDGYARFNMRYRGSSEVESSAELSRHVGPASWSFTRADWPDGGRRRCLIDLALLTLLHAGDGLAWPSYGDVHGRAHHRYHQYLFLVRNSWDTAVEALTIAKEAHAAETVRRVAAHRQRFGARGSWVYLISANNHLKIGVSTNVRKRIGQLRTGAATPILLVGQIEGGVEEERRFHGRFARYRAHGEWFRDVRVIRRAFGA